MIEENNSPLKQRQSSRGGKSAGKAASSGNTGGRGKGGRNVGGYNVNTSFAVKPAWKKPRSGGFIGVVASPKPTKPYTINNKGEVEVEPLTSSPLLPAAFGRKKGAFDTTDEKPTGTDINQFTKKTDAQDLGAKDRKIVAKAPDKKEVEAKYGKEEGKLPTYREAWDSNNEGVKDRKGKDGKAKYKNFEEFEADAMTYNKPTPAKAKQEVSAVPFKLKGSPMYRNFGVGGKPKK